MKLFFLISLLVFCSIGNAKADSSTLPACIKKLDRPGSSGIKSYNGGSRYTGMYQLKNGKALFSFRTEASIGCNRNEPASAKYYNDSCKLVASFPIKFSITQGFKPFVADGYLAADFRESSQGDYPAYFAKEEKLAAEKKATPQDPFPKEKSFKITSVTDDVFSFKKGDVIKIHTKSGLWHFPPKQSFKKYKIIPQLALTKIEAKCRVAPCFTTEKKELVYFAESIQRFIKIEQNILFISTTKQPDANTPTKAIELKWEPAYDLKAE